MADRDVSSGDTCPRCSKGTIIAKYEQVGVTVSNMQEVLTCSRVNCDFSEAR